MRRVLAIQSYVQELELCAEISGLFDNPLLGDEYPDELNRSVYNHSSEKCICMHCIAHIERAAMIYALPSIFSVHFFQFDPEVDIEHLIPGSFAAHFPFCKSLTWCLHGLCCLMTCCCFV